MTPKETRDYFEAIHSAKHLNADQRLACNMFVSFVEFAESGGNRNHLDELLRTHGIVGPKAGISND